MNSVLWLNILFVLPIYTIAQDTAHKKWGFKKELIYWSNWHLHSLYAQVSMPDAIRGIRKNTTQLPISFDTLTDNPLTHGATYVALKTQTTYLNKIILFADLYAEHRGVSYGIFNKSNTVVYPIMRLEGLDTINLFSKQIIVKGKAGEFLNERMDEGLMVYNIDVQGFQLKYRFKKWVLGYTVYGDLYGGIGLNIDDLYSFLLKKNFSDDKNYIGLSLVTAKPPFYKHFDNRIINLFGRKTFKSSALYAQLGIRIIDRENFVFIRNLRKQAGLVAGYSIKKKSKYFEFTSQAEARYYGYVFNISHADFSLRYRKPAKDIYEMYANTVGEYLYPLRKFETLFSQWAVFTEYGGYNLGGISVAGNSIYMYSKKLNISIDYDINYITARFDDLFSDPVPKKSSFLYPFFTLNFIYKPAENTNVTIFFTNKTMNLDIHYPTHYFLSRPCIGLKVFANFQ
ncbi:MAG TPA: hypothetical protein VGP43_01030 [Chitinophagaceae bacterium]|nr:hypothetical protein [Chitinophagaceae bacterium]